MTDHLLGLGMSEEQLEKAKGFIEDEVAKDCAPIKRGGAMKNPCAGDSCVLYGDCTHGSIADRPGGVNHHVSCIAYAQWLSYQQCLKDLAEKCGPKPCVGCSWTDTNEPKPECDCPNLERWEGQQEGCALTESKVSAARADGVRERENLLLNWLAHNGMGLTITDLTAWQEYLKEVV